MKCQSSWLLLFLSLACTRPEKDVSGVSLLGGKPATILDTNSNEMKTFTSTAELSFADATQCTATRVGPRHFLTAAHCLKNVKELTLRSHKTNQRVSVRVSSESLVSAGSQDVNYGPEKILLRDGGSDWALLIASAEGSLSESLFMMKNLDDNFDTRKIGDPALIQKEDVLLVAGWGVHDRDNSILLRCVEGRDCEIPDFYETATQEQRTLRRAFFRISDIAKTSSDSDAFFFEAITRVDPLPFDYTGEGGGKGIEFIAGVLPDDDYGILQGGDSGGPVILEKEGEQYIVGVVKGSVSFTTNPEIRENFSTFNKIMVENKLKQPIIDTISSYTRPGRSLLLTGHLTGNVEIRALDSGAVLKADPLCSNLNDRDRIYFNQGLDWNKSGYSCWTVPVEMQPQWLEVFFEGVSTGKKVEVLGVGQCSEQGILNNGVQSTVNVELSFIGTAVSEIFWPETGVSMEQTYPGVPYDEWPRSFDKVTLAIGESGGIPCLGFREDASCIVPPEIYSFEIKTHNGTHSLQTPSWQYFTDYRIDITKDFSEWLASSGPELSKAPFPVVVTAFDQSVYEGLSFQVDIHTCDPQLEP